MNHSAAIGIFDSGIGGLSVYRAIRQILPAQPVIYFADQQHVPYGSRPLEEVRKFSEAITHFLIQHGAALIVVACNTASAAALHHLRVKFPHIPFVGMEPAVKPAAEITRSGKVGVLATPATFQGALYASVVERFASGVQLITDTCHGLVQEIEAGRLNGGAANHILHAALAPMLREGIDTVVLGCTHYPFVIPLIEEICGPAVRVIDPAPAVARRTRHLLELHRLLVEGNQPAEVHFYTSGDPATLRQQVATLVGEHGLYHAARWEDQRILEVQSAI